MRGLRATLRVVDLHPPHHPATIFVTYQCACGQRAHIPLAAEDLTANVVAGLACFRCGAFSLRAVASC